MNAYSIGLVVSILVYLAVGNYAGRRVKHLEDYFVAGRNAPTLLIVGTLVASLMSTNAFMGESGVAYSGFPFVLILLTAINVVGYVAGALFFGRFLRRSRSLTLAEYFGNRFDSKRVRLVAGITIVFGCSAYLLVVTQGTATIIHEVTGLPMHWTLLISWGGYTLFTLYSGSQGVVLTDTIMFLLFATVAMMGMYFIFAEVGGWHAAMQGLATFADKPGIISWHGATGRDAPWETAWDMLVYSIILGLAWSIVVAVGPWQASRYMMARSEHTVIRSGVITAAVILVLYMVLMFSGAAINLVNAGIEPAQENMVWAALNLLPLFVGVLLISGIMAAGLSSASTFLTLVGFSLSNDIRPPQGQSDQQRLKSSRWAMLGASLVVLGAAYVVPEGKLFLLTYFAGTIFASSWGPVGIMSVWSKRITEAAAFWGIITGLLGNVAVNLVIVTGAADVPTVLDPILVGAVLSYLTIEMVIARSKVTPEEQARREALHITPIQEFDAERMQRTVRWSWVVMAAGVAIGGLLLAYWARPWQQATGQPGTGEVVMSLFVGGCLVIAGALARWGTLRYYGERAR
jgi:sodium/pantothenate symporter